MSDPSIVGQRLVVDGQPFTVIGVLPPNVLRYSAEFIKPLIPAEYPNQRGHRDLDVFARLRPGVTLAGAQAEVDTITRRLERDYPVTNRATTSGAKSSAWLATSGRGTSMKNQPRQSIDPILKSSNTTCT